MCCSWQTLNMSSIKEMACFNLFIVTFLSGDYIVVANIQQYAVYAVCSPVPASLSGVRTCLLYLSSTSHAWTFHLYWHILLQTRSVLSIIYEHLCLHSCLISSVIMFGLPFSSALLSNVFHAIKCCDTLYMRVNVS